VKTLVVVVCLVAAGVLPLTASARAQQAAEAPSPFMEARRVGEPDARAFYIFSTSAGNYIVRHDGMGEVALPTRRRKVFWVKVGSGARIQRLYFFEHQGELVLLYEASGSGYLIRLNQTTRKAKSIITLNGNFELPALKAEQLVFSDGTIVPLT
jgi:hypothetical protein